MTEAGFHALIRHTVRLANAIDFDLEVVEVLDTRDDARSDG